MSSRTWVAVVLTLLVAGCVTDGGGYQTASRTPACQYQVPITYAPVRLRINTAATYSMNNFQGFQRDTPWFLIESLDDINPGKYQLADGVASDINLIFTLTEDGQNHFGAHISAYLPKQDSWFRYSWPQYYVTPEKLIDDVADMIDQFVTQGWSYGTGNC